MKNIGIYRSLLLIFATFVLNKEHFVFIDKLLDILKGYIKLDEVNKDLEKLYRHNVLSDVVSEHGDIHINIHKKEAEKIRLRFDQEHIEQAKEIFNKYKEI